MIYVTVVVVFVFLFFLFVLLFFFFFSRSTFFPLNVQLWFINEKKGEHHAKIHELSELNLIRLITSIRTVIKFLNLENATSRFKYFHRLRYFCFQQFVFF